MICALGWDLITSLRKLHRFHCLAQSTFDETDQRQTSLTKLYSFQQGSRPASVYASEFRQVACDISWDDQALCDHFHRGLRNDVKTLLLKFPEPTSLSQVIFQAVQCDNLLFEQCSEWQKITWYRSEPNYVLVTLKPSQKQTNDSSSHDAPIPMEIDTTSRRWQF